MRLECDRCSPTRAQWSWLKWFGDTPRELLLCAHHHNENYSRLRTGHWRANVVGAPVIITFSDRSETWPA